MSGVLSMRDSVDTRLLINDEVYADFCLETNFRAFAAISEFGACCSSVMVKESDALITVLQIWYIAEFGLYSDLGNRPSDRKNSFALKA